MSTLSRKSGTIVRKGKLDRSEAIGVDRSPSHDKDDLKQQSEALISTTKQMIDLLTKLIGFAYPTVDKPYSAEKIEIAARHFRKLRDERREWIKESDLGKYIKDAPYGVGKFLREEFQFCNYYKTHQYYYNRKDIEEFVNELSTREVNLKLYMDLLRTETKFRKNVEMALSVKVKKGIAFRIPNYLKDLIPTQGKAPTVGEVEHKIRLLRLDYDSDNISEYVELYYNDTLAYPKSGVRLDLLDFSTRMRCLNWMDNFNSANEIMKKLTGRPRIEID
jgi:hypothetical protein